MWLITLKEKTLHRQDEQDLQEKNKMEDEELTEKIIGCAYAVHNALGPGFLEKVYENALRIELEKQRLSVKQQEPINVLYDSQVVGEYYADLWVDERVVVELKAAQTLAKEHEVQLGNYLTATGIDSGLLLNFGPSVQVKRKFREYKPKVPFLNSILQNPVNPVDERSES
jgi:GxxExxY protein